jgi:hypothetical protein
MAGGGRRRRLAAANTKARLHTGDSGNEMVMMEYGMMGGTSFAHGAGELSNSIHQQQTRDTKLGISKAADEEALSPFDPRAWFTEMARFALFLIFFSVTIFSGKQGQDIFDCECAIISSFCLLYLNFDAVTDIVYTLLGTNDMLAGSSEYNTPGKVYDFLNGPMSLIYAGGAFSGDDFVTSGEQFFNGLRLLEDVSIRQIRVSGRECGRTARMLFDESICFDNSFLLDPSKEERQFRKTSEHWTIPDPLGTFGSSLHNNSRDAWLWSSGTESGESRFLARYHVYPASGYKTFLPRNGTEDFIKYLQDNYWIDPKTNGVIVSFVLYSSTLVRCAAMTDPISRSCTPK